MRKPAGSRFFALTFLFCTTLSNAQDKPNVVLNPGDAAPLLAVDKWVKGEPVKDFAKGSIYVLEFWATWCGPCIAVTPHVTEVQKKFKDKGVVVIGIDVWEEDDAAVEPLVKKLGDKMDYRVATDDKSNGGKGKMAETWLVAAGQTSIPTTFIVDRDGKIAWIGRPQQMEKVLQKIIDGTFDVAHEAACQAKVEAATQKINSAVRAKDWDKALAAADELITADPDIAPGYSGFKVHLLYQKKDYKAANKLARELSEGEYADDQKMLMALAYALVGHGDPKEREVDLNLALSVAEKAAAMGGDSSKRAKVFVAKAQAAKGNYAKAVEAQAAALEGTEGRKPANFQEELDLNLMRKDLKEYKAKAKSKDAKQPSPA